MQQELVPLNYNGNGVNWFPEKELRERKTFKVKTFEEKFKIPKCAFISVEKKDHVFYSCTCTDDESALICKECVKYCHQGPGHITSKFDK